MATPTGITWIVGTATEVGVLEERLGSADATIRETWPGGANAGIVALVQAGPDAADDVREALGPDAAPFDDEGTARQAAADLALRA
jgi:hypothetical protein